MVITLKEVKTYLRVDGDEEDMLITSFIIAAEEMCEGILRYALDELTLVPETVKQAIFYIVGQLYENREQVPIDEILEVVKCLLFNFRKESW
ncbi:head-tail connector protein [Zhenhengia yiwuensis]|jgi:uncharacterized phage protein (predicted DNA packaging)|uniref:head-tail connector protein n=1 Tax=Zhenhengia yiwuensis TaxID=2763666 RepID=UPI002A754596|nr:head-tail connector protein [Zhenhengia yiwuensis]MDY3369024.1 head-tail connector protein [Zhenhengia yiwuensis]